MTQITWRRMSYEDNHTYVLLTIYFLGDQIEKNEMGGAFGTYRGQERGLVVKRE